MTPELRCSCHSSDVDIFALNIIEAPWSDSCLRFDSSMRIIYIDLHEPRLACRRIACSHLYLDFLEDLFGFDDCSSFATYLSLGYSQTRCSSCTVGERRALLEQRYGSMGLCSLGTGVKDLFFFCAV